MYIDCCINKGATIICPDCEESFPDEEETVIYHVLKHLTNEENML
tara:strand:+ start:860 stop:994 length:135 start_codon:yes stop_codon:yes gene_type:complete